MSSTFSASFEVMRSPPSMSTATSPFSSPVQLATPLALPELATPAITIGRHPRYFLQDDLAVFLVEDCLFQVHRHFLDRESDVFPRGSRSNPISLPGVTKFEFESLLDYFYEGMNTTFKPSLESWKSILSISSRFEMTKLRTRAIDEITAFYPHIDPADQIVLAVQYDVSKWLSTGYKALVRRESPLECEEARKLGVDTTCLIAKARETYRHATKSQGNVELEADRYAVASNGEWTQCQQEPCDPPPRTKVDDATRLDRVVQDVFFPRSKIIFQSPSVINQDLPSEFQPCTECRKTKTTCKASHYGLIRRDLQDEEENKSGDINPTFDSPSSLFGTPSPFPLPTKKMRTNKK